METKTCYLTGLQLPEEEVSAFDEIKKPIVALIHRKHPGFAPGMFISNLELNRYRKKYLSKLITSEQRDLNKLEKEVVAAINNDEILSRSFEAELEGKLTNGQKMADRIATFGGSWVFIIVFFSFLLIWMLTNVWVIAARPFDPYPFILLNLILSCIAAIQAPIIMMSQNRQEQKDRARSEHDFKVNLKAELEVRLLNEKIDHMIVHQNKRLIKIQELQIDYLEQLVGRVKKK